METIKIGETFTEDELFEPKSREVIKAPLTDNKVLKYANTLINGVSYTLAYSKDLSYFFIDDRCLVSDFISFEDEVIFYVDGNSVAFYTWANAENEKGSLNVRTYVLDLDICSIKDETGSEYDYDVLGKYFLDKRAVRKLKNRYNDNILFAEKTERWLTWGKTFEYKYARELKEIDDKTKSVGIDSVALSMVDNLNTWEDIIGKGQAFKDLYIPMIRNYIKSGVTNLIKMLNYKTNYIGKNHLEILISKALKRNINMIKKLYKAYPYKEIINIDINPLNTVLEVDKNGVMFSFTPFINHISDTYTYKVMVEIDMELTNKKMKSDMFILTDSGIKMLQVNIDDLYIAEIKDSITK